MVHLCCEIFNVSTQWYLSNLGSICSKSKNHVCVWLLPWGKNGTQNILCNNNAILILFEPCIKWCWTRLARRSNELHWILDYKHIYYYIIILNIISLSSTNFTIWNWRSLHSFAYPSGGTRHIAARSLTDSNMLWKTLGSTERAKIIRASSWLITCIKPYCQKKMDQSRLPL